MVACHPNEPVPWLFEASCGGSSSALLWALGGNPAVGWQWCCLLLWLMAVVGWQWALGAKTVFGKKETAPSSCAPSPRLAIALLLIHISHHFPPPPHPPPRCLQISEVGGVLHGHLEPLEQHKHGGVLRHVDGVEALGWAHKRTCSLRHSQLIN